MAFKSGRDATKPSFIQVLRDLHDEERVYSDEEILNIIEERTGRRMSTTVLNNYKQQLRNADKAQALKEGKPMPKDLRTAANPVKEEGEELREAA